MSPLFVLADDVETSLLSLESVIAGLVAVDFFVFFGGGAVVLSALDYSSRCCHQKMCDRLLKPYSLGSALAF